MKEKICILIFLMLISTTLIVNGLSYEECNCIGNNFPLYQKCDIEWSRTYGGDEFDIFLCVQQTNDEGFIVSGSTEISNSYYPLLIKLNSIGDEEWRWTITEISYDGLSYDISDVYPVFCNQVRDGGYLLCLWIDFTSEQQLHTIGGLFKFNQQGQQVWSAFYPEDLHWSFRPISFIEHEEAYIVTGTAGGSESYMGDVAGLLKIDLSGNQIWYQEYDYGDGDDRMEAVCYTTDGGFLLAGWAKDTSYNYWIIKTDEYGNEEWNNIYGGKNNDYGHTKACYQTNDGGYLLGGFSSSYGVGGSDVWIVKTDAEGTMLWNKTYGDTKNDVCWDIEATTDGGFVFVATMNYGGFTGDRDDINLVKIDSYGYIEWVQEYAGQDVQMGTSLDETLDGCYIVSGGTDRFYSSRSDGLLVKFTNIDNQRPVKPSVDGPTRGKPETEYTFTARSSDSDGSQLFYKWDWGDGNYSDWIGDTEAYYAWANENTYEIRVIAKDEHGGESEWSDPLVVSMPRYRKINPLSFRFYDNYFSLLSILRNICDD